MKPTLSELSANYDKFLDVVITNAVGEMIRINLQAAAKKALTEAKKNNCHFLLFDFTKLVVNRSLIEGFTDISNFGNVMGISQDYYCAVHYNVENCPEERANLIESVPNTMVNPPYRMFQIKKEALNWLKDKQRIKN